MVYVMKDLAEANPENVARFGHVAILLRRYLDETGMAAADFNEFVLRIDRRSTTIYAWTGARAAPSHNHMERMSKAMGVPYAFFVPNDLNAPPKVPPEKLKVPSAWANRAATEAPGTAMVALPAPKLMGRPPGSTTPPLTFRINGDGTARITVDVTLPTGRVTSILRVLLEAGLEEASMLTEPS